MTDATLVDRWMTHRDAGAFREIYLRHAGMVYGTCLRLLQDPSQAEEVAQEAFEALVCARSVPRDYLGPWLYRVSVNLALKRARHNRNRSKREERYAKGQPRTMAIEWDDIYGHVDEAIADLPDKYRTTLVAHFLEGRSQADIGQMLSTPRQTITNRVNRGLELVRKSLRHRGIDLETPALSGLLALNLRIQAPPSLMRQLGRLSLTEMHPAVKAAVTKGVFLMSKAKLAAILVVLLAAITGAYMLVQRDALAPNAPLSTVQEPEDFSHEDDLSITVAQPTVEEDTPARDDPPREESLEVEARHSTAGTPPPGRNPSARPGMVALDEALPEREVIGTISGWVIQEDGAGLGGVSISARGNAASGSTTSEGDGAFSVELTVAADQRSDEAEERAYLFEVEATKEDYVPTSELRVPLDAVDVELVLTRQGEIRGVVVDARTGIPIQNFEARIVRHRNPVEGMMGTARPWTPFSSEEGTFVLPTQYDVGQIAARAKGHTERKVDILVPKGEIREGVSIELETAAAVTGVVIDKETLQPVEGAQVATVNGHIRQWWGINEGNFSFQAISDADGRFQIDSVNLYDYVDIMAWHEAYAPAFVIDHGPEARGDVRLLLSQGGAITGTVLRAGEPVSGLRMWAGLSFGRPYEHGDAPPEAAVFLALAGTNATGQYAFSRLPEGRYQFRAMDVKPGTPLEGRYLERRWVDVREGETALIDIEVGKGSIVGGHVLGVEDLSKVQLRLFDQRYPEQTLYSTEERHDCSKPDASGYFEFSAVPAGDYYVRATLTAPREQIVDAPCQLGDSEIIEVVLDFGSSTEGDSLQ